MWFFRLSLMWFLSLVLLKAKRLEFSYLRYMKKIHSFFPFLQPWHEVSSSGMLPYLITRVKNTNSYCPCFSHHPYIMIKPHQLPLVYQTILKCYKFQNEYSPFCGDLSLESSQPLSHMGMFVSLIK